MHLCLILLNEGVFRRRSADGAGCGARAQVSHTWTREAFGTPLGRHYECPARSWLTSGRDQKWSDEKRGPRTEIAAVERREARRSWTGNLRQNGDRPDREAGHEVRRIPHQRRLGAPPPSHLLRGNYRKARAQPASRERGGLFEIRIKPRAALKSSPPSSTIPRADTG